MIDEAEIRGMRRRSARTLVYVASVFAAAAVFNAVERRWLVAVAAGLLAALQAGRAWSKYKAAR